MAALWYVAGVLSKEQEEDGFAVFDDEDFVYVKRFGEVYLVFSSAGATRESIREAVEYIRKSARKKKGAEDSNPRLLS